MLHRGSASNKIQNGYFFQPPATIKTNVTHRAEVFGCGGSYTPGYSYLTPIGVSEVKFFLGRINNKSATIRPIRLIRVLPHGSLWGIPFRVFELSAVDNPLGVANKNSRTGRRTREQLHSLTVYLQNMGVVTFLINETQNITGTLEATNIPATYLL